MKSIKNDPSLANLPEPMALTPEQVKDVAGGAFSLSLASAARIIICGGFPPYGPILNGGFGNVLPM